MLRGGKCVTVSVHAFAEFANVARRQLSMAWPEIAEVLGVPAVLAENGCIEYGATVDAEGTPPIQTKFGPDTFVVVEKWADSAALPAHAAAPQMAAYAAKTREHVASRVIHVLAPT